VSRLEAELEAMRAAAAAGEVSKQVDHDVGFHRLIVEAAANRTLLEVWDSMGIHGRTAVTFLKGSLSGEEVVESHVPILEALSSGDPELAATRIHEHFQMFASLLRRERMSP
jgi:DNA-binding GntR family transcriptional regulator